MQLRRIAALWAFMALLACLPACTTGESTPELLHVLDVVPREADVGDRMELFGTGFPEGKAAKVVFEGTLYRPGHRPTRSFEIAIDGVSTSNSRVELSVTEGLRSAFCGTGDQAIHTTFEGNILVSFPSGTPGALPVLGSLRNVRLDFQPTSERRAVRQAREREGERALAFMGIGVADSAPASGGLLVTEVRRGSPADQTGIFPGDLVTSFDGVRVFGSGDISPASASRFASIGLVRGAGSGHVGSPGGREVVRSISIQGFKPSAPADLLAAGLLLLVACAAVAFFASPSSHILTWMERRIASRFPQAPASHRAGAAIWARLGQGFRSILREDVLPEGQKDTLSRLAPYLVFLATSALFGSMPFGQHLVAADLDVIVLFIVAVTLLVTMGLLTAGSTKTRGFSWPSGLRAIGELVTYEIPGCVAIACIVVMTGSLRVEDIVLAQGGWPWQWFVFQSPIAFALFFLWMAMSLVEVKRGPDTEANRASLGFGIRNFFFFFAEWGNVFVMCGLASLLFLGGWQLPGMGSLAQDSSFWLQMAGAIWLQLKMWTLVFLVVWARWMLPRVRMDQMRRLCWKALVPSTFAAFVLTALWALWSPPEAVQTLVNLGTFAFFLLLAGYFVSRLRLGLRTTPAQMQQLNPLL